jgi:hypothetical protein
MDREAYEAVKANDHKTLERRLKTGRVLNVNAPNSQGLRRASTVASWQLYVCSYVPLCGAIIKPPWVCSMLHFACYKGFNECARYERSAHDLPTASVVVTTWSVQSTSPARRGERALNRRAEWRNAATPRGHRRASSVL